MICFSLEAERLCSIVRKLAREKETEFREKVEDIKKGIESQML